MYLPIDATLVSEFEAILISNPKPNRKKEQEVQDFLEGNSEFIITWSRLGYKLHMNSVISKFPLSTNLITDFVYIVKTSGEWEITLVELEDPRKLLFKSSHRSTQPSAHLTQALAQIRDWKLLVQKSGNQIVEALSPLLKPHLYAPGPTKFRYQLVFGRSAEKNASEDRQRHFMEIRDEHEIELFTYDQLIEIYRQNVRQKRNIMRKAKQQFAFKSLVQEPHHIFSHLGPDVIDLSTEQEADLMGEGYDMRAWKSGVLLTLNHRNPISSFRR